MSEIDSAARIGQGPNVAGSAVAEVAKINVETTNENDLHIILAYIVVPSVIQLKREKTAALTLCQL